MRRWAWLLLALAVGGLALGAVLLREGAPRPTARAPASPAGEPRADTHGSAAGPDSPVQVAPGPGRTGAATSDAALDRARTMLQTIEARSGEPLPGYVGGRAFHNREGRLPAGQYREYDVHPRTAGRDRGPERLVVEQRTGKAYFTADHYRTFVPLR